MNSHVNINIYKYIVRIIYLFISKHFNAWHKMRYYYYFVYFVFVALPLIKNHNLHSQRMQYEFMLPWVRCARLPVCAPVIWTSVHFYEVRRSRELYFAVLFKNPRLVQKSSTGVSFCRLYRPQFADPTDIPKKILTFQFQKVKVILLKSMYELENWCRYVENASR